MPRCCKPAYHDAAQRANLQPVVQHVATQHMGLPEAGPRVAREPSDPNRRLWVADQDCTAVATGGSVRCSKASTTSTTTAPTARLAPHLSMQAHACHICAGTPAQMWQA
jgi:hypothetical protein